MLNSEADELGSAPAELKRACNLSKCAIGTRFISFNNSHWSANGNKLASGSKNTVLSRLRASPCSGKGDKVAETFAAKRVLIGK